MVDDGVKGKQPTQSQGKGKRSRSAKLKLGKSFGEKPIDENDSDEEHAVEEEPGDYVAVDSDEGDDASAWIEFSKKGDNLGEQSDSSDDEGMKNRIGNVPLEWYDNYDHIGYDVSGKKIIRKRS